MIDWNQIYGWEDFEPPDEHDPVLAEIKRLGGRRFLNAKDIKDFTKAMFVVLRILSDYQWHTRQEIDARVGQDEATRRLRRLRGDDFCFVIDCRRSSKDYRVFEYQLKRFLKPSFPMIYLWKTRVRKIHEAIEAYSSWRSRHGEGWLKRIEWKRFLERRYGFSYERYETELKAKEEWMRNRGTLHGEEEDEAD